jgi:phosphopantothenoylcysteine decarboxylase/phosphopantothenate--cysteine ligase
MLKSPSQRVKTLNKKVLHVLTGSIAAFKAPEISGALRQAGCDVTCILTASAKKFVTVDALQALSGNRAYDDLWSRDFSASELAAQPGSNVIHTSLADSADLILVAPASANFLARVAAGMADDLAACVLLASACPVWWAPAMNDNMFKNPLTQANIEKLKKIGHHFIDPVEGHLVCGRTAVGHIAETDAIVKAVLEALKIRS